MSNKPSTTEAASVAGRTAIKEAEINELAGAAVGDTAAYYNEGYFKGNQAESNYGDYTKDAIGPSRILADTLFSLFSPKTALDMGCAVGYTVKGLRDLGVEASGYDISEWAVEHANVPYIKQFDFSLAKIQGTYDLVYSYDVIEHVVPERLEFAISNLWSATEKHLVVVPALYAEGTTSDPNEPTHLIFHDYNWWLSVMEGCGCVFNSELSDALNAADHSKIFNYAGRAFVFSK